MIFLPASPAPVVVDLPQAWLGAVIEPAPVEIHEDPARLVKQALDQPIDAPPVEELARPGQKIVVIVDDITRQTPIRLALPLLLERLALAGAAPSDISILIALGGHRLMTAGETADKIGAALVQTYRIIQSNEPEALIYLGQASNGIPAWVHRAALEADLRIGLGMISPHMDAGFSGGAKIVLPGVCGAATLNAFHAGAAQYQENPLGNPHAPLRLVLEQFVQERAPLDYILNLILTPQAQVVHAVAGHPLTAHRQGVRCAQQVYGAAASRRYPVVVANCAPYQQDLWQSCKGLWCGDLLTADGGILVWVTQSPEGCRGYRSLPGYIGSDPDELKRRLEAGETPDPAAAATGVMIGRIKKRIQIVLVSSGLSAAEAASMGLPHFEQVEEAVAWGITRLPAAERSGSVAVIPRAGVVLPLLPGSSPLTGPNSDSWRS